MDHSPFDAQAELYKKLSKSTATGALYRANAKKSYLPGQPHIQINDATVESHLESEFMTKDLDRLAPHLWLVGKQDSSHISSLTHQRVRGREIVITENPELHLLWIDERVFIKPLPKYLLSHSFWEFYLINKDTPISKPRRLELQKAALGFLRSYSYLIQHKSDFEVAKDKKLLLLPKNVKHADFVKFIISFAGDKILDTAVAPRYHFGELRLSRINFWSKLFLRRFTFQKVHGQYGSHFARFYGPLLFIFGVLSVTLSAMQVALSAISDPYPPSSRSWMMFARVSRIFAIVTLVIVAAVTFFLLGLLLILLGRELVFSLYHLWNRSKNKTKSEEEGN